MLSSIFMSWQRHSNFRHYLSQCIDAQHVAMENRISAACSQPPAHFFTLFTSVHNAIVFIWLALFPMTRIFSCNAMKPLLTFFQHFWWQSSNHSELVLEPVLVGTYAVSTLHTLFLHFLHFFIILLCYTSTGCATCISLQLIKFYCKLADEQKGKLTWNWSTKFYTIDTWSPNNAAFPISIINILLNNFLLQIMERYWGPIT